MKVAVSYLKSIYEKKETIQKINESSADYIHVDLIDGIFCGERNYEIQEIMEDLQDVTKPIDIHLMVNDPKEEIECLAKLKPSCITIPVEIPNVNEFITLIKSYSIPAGLSINPETSIEKILPFLSNIDVVLVMTVHPGKGGQEFMESVIPKLQEIYNLKKNFEISIDGGINDQTVSLVSPYADRVVSGSFVCMQEDFESQIGKLKNDAK